MIRRDRIKFAMLASKIQPIPLDEPRRPVKFSATPGEIHEALASNPFDRRTWHMLADSLAEHGKPALSEAVRELASSPEVEEQNNKNSGGPRLMIGPKLPHTYEYMDNPFVHGTIAGVPVDIRGRYLHVESGDGKRVYGTNYVKAKHIKEIAKEVDGKPDTRIPYDRLSRSGRPVKMSATPAELHKEVAANVADDRLWHLLADSLEEHGKPHTASVVRQLAETKKIDDSGRWVMNEFENAGQSISDPIIGYLGVPGHVAGVDVRVSPFRRKWLIRISPPGGMQRNIWTAPGSAYVDPDVGLGMLHEMEPNDNDTGMLDRFKRLLPKQPERLRRGAPIRFSATPLDIHSELINNRHDPRLWHLLADSVEELGKPALAAHFRDLADNGGVSPGVVDAHHVDHVPETLNMDNHPLFDNGITTRAAGIKMRFLPMRDTWMVRTLGNRSRSISLGWLHPSEAIPILHEMDDEPENATLARAKATFPLKAKLRRGQPIRMSATPAEIHDAVTENAHDRRLWHLLADSLEEHGKPAIAGALRHLAATGNEASTTTGYRYLRNNMERDGTFGRNEVGTISGVPVYIFDDGRIWIDAKKSAPSPGILSAPIGVARDVFEEFDNPSAEHQSEVHPEKYSRRQPIRFSATPQEIHAAISENPHDRRLWALLADSMEEAGKPWFGKAMREIGTLAEQQHSPHFGGIMSHWIDVPRDDHGGMNLEAKSQGNVSGIPIIMYRFHRNQSIIGINSGPLSRWYMAVMHKNGIPFNPIGIYGLMDPEHGARIHNEIDEFKGQVPYHHDVEDLRSHDEYRPNQFQRIKFARPDQHEEMWKAIADRPGDTRTWPLYSDMVREEGHQHLADALKRASEEFKYIPESFRRQSAYGRHEIPGIKAVMHYHPKGSHVDLFIPKVGWSGYKIDDTEGGREHISGMLNEFRPWINQEDPDNVSVGAPNAHNRLRATLGMPPFEHAPIELKKDSRPTRLRATMIRAIKAKRAA